MSAAAPVDRDSPRPTPSQRARAYAVHVYTASGVALAFLAAVEMCAAVPDPTRVFLYLAGTVVIDATDGPFARRWHVKRWAAGTDGRTIDDIVDYLTYTFLPLLLVWRMGWLPEPGALFVVPALVASLFGFANTAAKDEEGGFFLGFPSYWNAVAFYAGIWHHLFGPWVNAVVILALAALTLAPIGFVYPNLAPRRWRLPVTLSALAWLVLAIWMLRDYPDVPAWAMWLSLVPPLFYTAVSAHLWSTRGSKPIRPKPM
jgi:phosphatidylcholine synthase